MARKLIDQDEAAQMLGVSLEELNTMREKRKVHGVRDGGMWKYKQEDLDRAKSDMRDSAGSSGLELQEDEPLELDDNLESILLSESELGGSASDTSATVIGKAKDPAQSDLRLADDSDIDLAPIDSDVKLAADTSGIELAGDSDLQLAGSDLGLGSSGSSDIRLAATDDLELDDSDSVFGTKADLGMDSALNLEEDRDVVTGSKPDSDITLQGSDSGISIVDPADSGLSLEEEPAELAGSAVDMMELGAEDVISLEEEADLDAATQLRTEDDFLLTPLDDAGVDESDSGSQVIALDADEDFAAAGNMFGSSPGMGGAMLEEDEGSDAGMGGGGSVSAAPMGTMVAMPSVPEAPYSLWNVMALVCCAFFLSLCGMMMYDLVRHMWSWDQPYAINSSIMNGILGMIEGK